ncbi:MAG: hypothetical protein DRJ03_16115 [Chloroflexi bacterium]|nr:MAG: hypothetical protein DRJ03_16115 [Chloroflexota bacterium]
MDKTKVRVICPGGIDLPSGGHKGRGEEFELSTSLARLLARAAPGKFEIVEEKKATPKTRAKKEM